MPDAFADQVRQTLRNVQTILETAGSSLENVVKVNAYVTDLTRFAEFNEVYREFFSHDPRHGRLWPPVCSGFWWKSIASPCFREGSNNNEGTEVSRSLG